MFLKKNKNTYLLKGKVERAVRLFIDYKGHEFDLTEVTEEEILKIIKNRDKDIGKLVSIPGLFAVSNKHKKRSELIFWPAADKDYKIYFIYYPKKELIMDHNYLAKNLPMCAKCKRQVVRIEFTYSLEEGCFVYTVHCHGETEITKMPHNSGDVKPGVAFLDKIEQEKLKIEK